MKKKILTILVLSLCLIFSTVLGGCSTEKLSTEKLRDIDFTVVDEDDVPKDNGEDVSGSIMDSANDAYTITMVTHEGVKTEYQLVGKTLTNLTTNQTYKLTQTQANELRTLLGIPN